VGCRIFAFTESPMQLAPLCIGGNSIAVLDQLSPAAEQNHNAPELVFEPVEVAARRS